MSFELDIPTLLIAIILGHLLIGMLLFAYMVNHKKDRSVSMFFVSKLLEMLAWTLLASRERIPDVLSINVANSILLFATTLQIGAFLVLKECLTPPLKKGYIVFCGFSIILFNVVAFGGGSGSMRIITMSSLVIVLWIYPIWRLLSEGQASALQRLIAGLYGVAMGSLVYRTASAIVHYGDMQLMSSGMNNALSFVSSYLLMMAGSVGFILLSKEASDKELVMAATYDGLTGIYNRRAFIARAAEDIANYSRKKEHIAVLLVDIDKFKRVNDTYGHYSGDKVLKTFTQLIGAQLRKYDLFGRLGGEEFIILLPGIDEAAAYEVAERLRRTVEMNPVTLEHPIPLTISIGLTVTVPDRDTTIDLLYKRSDDALYSAKEKGRNRVEIALNPEISSPS